MSPARWPHSACCPRSSGFCAPARAGSGPPRPRSAPLLSIAIPDRCWRWPRLGWGRGSPGFFAPQDLRLHGSAADVGDSSRPRRRGAGDVGVATYSRAPPSSSRVQAARCNWRSHYAARAGGGLGRAARRARAHGTGTIQGSLHLRSVQRVHRTGRVRGDSRERRHLARARPGTAGADHGASVSAAAGYDLGRGRARPLPGADGDACAFPGRGQPGATAGADPTHAIAATPYDSTWRLSRSGSSCRGSSPGLRPRGGGWRRCLPLGIAAAILLIQTRSLGGLSLDPASPVIPPVSLYSVAMSARPEQADLETAIRAADEAATPGTALLVLGSALSWHQQLWAPLWTERPLFYDNWLWYWHPDHAGNAGVRLSGRAPLPRPGAHPRARLSRTSWHRCRGCDWSARARSQPHRRSCARCGKASTRCMPSSIR